jgi:hypothetical protein
VERTPAAAQPALSLQPGSWGSRSCVDACVDARAADISVDVARTACFRACAGDAFLVTEARDVSLKAGSRVAVEGRVAQEPGGLEIVLEDGARVWLADEAPASWGEVMQRRVRVIGTLEADRSAGESVRLVDYEAPILLDATDDAGDTG